MAYNKKSFMSILHCIVEYVLVHFSRYPHSFDSAGFNINDTFLKNLTLKHLRKNTLYYVMYIILLLIFSHYMA